QQNQWEKLQQRREQSLPHALLLTGPQGMGKLSFAQAFAEDVLCCGDNAAYSAQLLQAGNHSDYFEVQPEEAGKAIKVDQIRALVAKLNQTPQISSYQVALINPAENMNIAAANALLKTLEEPPGNVVLLLVTHRASGLLPTIRSRCQQISFPVPPVNIVREWLVDQVQDKAVIDGLIRQADGIPLNALALTQSDALAERVQLLKAFIALCEGSQTPVQLAELCQKEQAEEVFLTLSKIALDLLRLKQGLVQQMTFPQA
ncbi:unnamed protein product, partial [marine sediment metagenome]